MDKTEKKHFYYMYHRDPTDLKDQLEYCAEKLVRSFNKYEAIDNETITSEKIYTLDDDAETEIFTSASKYANFLFDHCIEVKSALLQIKKHTLWSSAYEKCLYEIKELVNKFSYLYEGKKMQPIDNERTPFSFCWDFYCDECYEDITYKEYNTYIIPTKRETLHLCKYCYNKID